MKFIPYFTGSSEEVVIAISLARIYVNNVAPISVYACLVHSDKLRTYSNANAQHAYVQLIILFFVNLLMLYSTSAEGL